MPTPTVPRRRTALRLAARLAPLLLPLLSAACSRAPELAPVRAHGTLYSLLALFEPGQVLEAPEAVPPKVDLLRPVGDGTDDQGQLQALIVAAPTHLRLPLGEFPEGARLRYEVGVRGNGFQGGAVTVRGEAGGRVVFEHVLDCSRDLPREERRWHPHELDLAGLTTLDVFVEYDGPREQGPLVGLARLLVSVPFEVERQRATRARPNLVLVVIDTLRADALGAYGATRPTSPRIDALARDGLRVARAYSAGPWTLPGTASVLTGKSPPEHGIGASATSSLAHALDTLPEVLQREGWTTAGFTCNPLIDGGRNFDAGFEHFENFRWKDAVQVEGSWLGWLDAHAAERFFLYLHLVEPHFPYTPGPEHLAAVGVEAPDPEDYLAGDLRDEVKRWYAGGGEPRERLLHSARVQADLYDAEVRASDDAVGRVLDRLAALGLDDRTVVCVTSDHGEEFLEHGWAQHNAQLWDESVRVPLVLHGPGVPRGVVVEGPLENRHLAPTLLALGGVPMPAGLRGPDLCDPEERALLAREPVFVMNTSGEYLDFEGRVRVRLNQFHSVLFEGWRLYNAPSHDRPDGARIELLYDLTADPECLVDRSAEHPERVLDLRRRIQDWLEAGRATRPALVPTADETRALLEQLGYAGGEDEGRGAGEDSREDPGEDPGGR